MMKRRSLLALLPLASLSLALSRNSTAANPTPAAPKSGGAFPGTTPLPMADGPFQPTDASLAAYRCPEWFRDAKFGIWSHWGPQCVPMKDSWYARRLYESDVVDAKGKSTGPSAAHKYHLEHYGHPSKFGFKDIIPLWKAEKFDPDALIALYKKAGAKYFVSLGIHHDNFALYRSEIHRWNAAAMGPKRDIVAAWRRAAAREGLRFGITEHLAASWWFYSASKGADKTGPLAGVPYDGNDPRFADLYWPDNHKPSFRYYGTDVPDSFKQAWYRRIAEIVDVCKPDLLYSDSPLPYPDDVGRRLVAHYYNSDARRNGGRVDVVYNCKEDARGRWVRDLERGVMEGINPEPWQTDTCIGNWYYQTGYKYKTSAQVVHMLIDIVSKNGNLLLNFPQRPDGTLDEATLRIISDIADWLPANGEGIYGTRPWKTFGEGPTKLGKGKFGGLHDTGDYTASDFRFTASKDGATVYAFCLGKPGREMRIASLGRDARLTEKPIAAVELLVGGRAATWRQDADALVVALPENLPASLATGMRIRFRG